MKLRSLGDTVLMTAAIEELHHAFPDAELDVAVMTAWAPLLEKQKGIRKIWTYDRHKEATARAKAVARLGLILRKERYDCVVNLHASPSSSALAYTTGAKVRAIHFHGHADKNRFSTVEIPGKGTLFPIIERDMNTLRALDLEIPTGKMPRIYLEPQELDDALDAIEQMGLTGPLLSLGIGASRPTKNWGIENYAKVATEWCKAQDGSVLALGSEDEASDCGKFLSLFGDSPFKDRIKAAAGFPIRKLAAVLRQSTVMLGNDSGPRHIAVAVGTPTVTLFGPEHPFEWHPYPVQNHPYFFIDNLACRRDAQAGMPAWCGLNECTVEKHKCMTSISAEDVIEKCLALAEGKNT